MNNGIRIFSSLPQEWNNPLRRTELRIEKYTHLNDLWFKESMDLKHRLARFLYYHKRLWSVIDFVVYKIGRPRWKILRNHIVLRATEL